MSAIKKGMKTILKLIGTIVLIGVLGISFLFVYNVINYTNTGEGIGFENYENYKKIIINKNGKINTYLIGNINFTENNEEFIIRPYSAYTKLSNNEKVVYRTILHKAEEIMQGRSNTPSVNVSFQNMKVDISNCTTYKELKAVADKAMSEIDYKNVYHALHADYEYYFWWEYNMNWSISDIELIVNNNNIKSSFFSIVLTPASVYAKDDDHIDTKVLSKAQDAYKTALSIATDIGEMSDKEKLSYFKDWILSNVSYDDEVLTLAKTEPEDKKVIESKNYISVFDKDKNTNAICGGYTNAFQLLCDLSDIDAVCLKEVGTVISGKEESEHAWNVIVIGEKFFLADITNSQKGTVGQNGDLFLKEIPEGSIYSIKINNQNVKYIEY